MRTFIRAALGCALFACLFLAGTPDHRTGVPTIAAMAQQAPAVVTPSGTTGAVVTTTGDVKSDTTISIGTYAGQALMWVTTAFAAPLGVLLVGIFYKLLQGVGFSLTDAWRARLEEAVVNGINAMAPKAAGALQGKLPVEVKNKLVRDVINYLATNVPDTLKKLGVDPTSASGQAVIEARVEKALNNPAVPTPASVTPPAGMAPSAATA